MAEIIGTSGNDTLIGTGEPDSIFGLGAGDDAASRGDGDDVLDGGEDDDQLRSAAGDDQLFGGPGRDRLDGGEGDDVLAGNRGADVLPGGAANNLLTGGSGPDAFVVTEPGSGFDQITDFTTGPDDDRPAFAADVLEDFDPATSNLTAFFDLDGQADGTLFRVDSDGGGDGFVPVALLQGG